MVCPYPQTLYGGVLSLSPKRRVFPDSTKSQGEGQRWSKVWGWRFSRDKDLGSRWKREEGAESGKGGVCEEEEGGQGRRQEPLLDLHAQCAVVSVWRGRLDTQARLAWY